MRIKVRLIKPAVEKEEETPKPVPVRIVSHPEQPPEPQQSLEPEQIQKPELSLQPRQSSPDITISLSDAPFWADIPPEILAEREKELEEMLKQMAGIEVTPPSNTRTSGEWTCAICGYTFDPMETTGTFRCPKCGAGGNPLTIGMFWVPE